MAANLAQERALQEGLDVAPFLLRPPGERGLHPRVARCGERRQEDRHADAHSAARLGDALQRGDRQSDTQQMFQHLLADDDVERIRRRVRIAGHQVVGDDRGVALAAIDRLDLDVGRENLDRRAVRARFEMSEQNARGATDDGGRILRPSAAASAAQASISAPSAS